MKLKRTQLASALVGLFTVFSFAITVPFMLGNAPVDDDILTPGLDEEENKLTPEQQKVQDIKDDLFANLSKSNLALKNMVLDVNHLGNENSELLLTFNGALDYLAFMDSYQTNTVEDDMPAKFDGNVNVRFLDNSVDAKYPVKLNESLDIYSRGTGKLYITWNNTNYSVSGKVINDVFEFLPVVYSDFDQIEEILNEVKNIDIITMLPMIINVLGSFSPESDLNQTPVNGLYSFTLTLPNSLLESVGASLGQDIVVTLKCDENGLLKYIGLNTINISGVEISLTSDCDMSLEEGFTSEIDETIYNNDLDCTTNMLTTIGSLIDEQKFAANFSLSLSEYKGDVLSTNHEFAGSMKGDISSESSFTKGAIYDVAITPSESLSSSVHLQYKDEVTYINFNDDIKGKIENTTFTDIFALLASETDNSDLESSTSGVNEVLSQAPLYEIIDGNWGLYKEYIKSLTIEDEVMNLTVNASLFTLPKYDFNIFIDLSNGKLNGLEIANLPFLETTKADGYTYVDKVSLKLDLCDYTPTTIETSEYATMKMATPLFKTIADVIKNKQIALDYDIQLNNVGATSYGFTGSIYADFANVMNLTSADFNDPALMLKEKDLGDYSLSMNTTINSITHNIKANFQDNGLYLDYYGLTENHARTRFYMTNQSLGNIFDFATGLIDNNTSTTKESSDPYEETNDLLTSLLDFTNGDIWNILKADTIPNITQYIDVSNSGNNDELVVNVDSKAFDQDFGVITLILGKNSQELSNITASVTTDNQVYTINLNFKAYDNSFLFAQEDIDNYFKNMDGTVDSIVNLINGMNQGIAIQGASYDANSQESKGTLEGLLNLSLNGFDSATDGVITSTTTSANETRKYEFQIDDTGALNFEYNDLIRAQSTMTSIEESLKEVSNITEDNLLYIYIEKILPVLNILTGSTSSSNSISVNMDNIFNALYDLDSSIYFEVVNPFEIMINLDINKVFSALMGSTYTSSNFMTLKLNFDSSKTINNLTPYLEVTIQDLVMSGTRYDFNVCLVDLTNEANFSTGVSFASDVGIIDLVDLPILVKMGIQTTKRDAYHIIGTLNMETTGIASWFISANCSATVNVYIALEDSVNDSGLFDVKCYINLDAYSNDSTNIWSTENTRDHIITEFYVYKMDAYIKRTYDPQIRKRSTAFHSWGSWSTNGSITYEYHKADAASMGSNVMFYIFEYALMQSDVYEQISSLTSSNSSDSSSSIDTVLDMIDHFGHNTSDQNNPYWHLQLDVYGIMDVYCDIYYNASTYDLHRVHVYTDFDIVIASVSLDLDAYNNYISGSSDIQPQIDQYDTFISNFLSHEATSNLGWTTDPANQRSDSSYFYSSTSSIF